MTERVMYRRCKLSTRVKHTCTSPARACMGSGMLAAAFTIYPSHVRTSHACVGGDRGPNIVFQCYSGIPAWQRTKGMMHPHRYYSPPWCPKSIRLYSCPFFDHARQVFLDAHSGQNVFCNMTWQKQCQNVFYTAWVRLHFGPKNDASSMAMGATGSSIGSSNCSS